MYIIYMDIYILFLNSYSSAVTNIYPHAARAPCRPARWSMSFLQYIHVTRVQERQEFSVPILSKEE